jgi:uncharacterized protein (TIGR03435 family)
MFQPGGRFRAINIPLKNLIASAFGVFRRPLPDFQLVGAPDWIKSERFDITVKAMEGERQDPAAMRSLLRVLLADRFKLRTHMETRQLPIYLLVLSRKDGKLGTQLRHSACAAFDGIDYSSGRMRAGCVTMTNLAVFFSDEVGRPVFDKTGLTGNFDAEAQWSPDQDASDSAPLPNAPSLFTAISEQLGLKLASDRGVVDVVVIDHIERPTPD